jgi:dCMP deaminase
MKQPHIVCLYMPVLHQGYRRFLEMYPQAQIVVVDEALAQKLQPSLKKDIRLLSAEDVILALQAWFPTREITILNENNFESLIMTWQGKSVSMPDEDVMKNLTEMLAKEVSAQFEVEYDSIFLRWDNGQTLKKHVINDDHTVSRDELDQKLISQAKALENHSADWWRQIGALIAKDGKVLLTGYNHHVPHEQEPYFNGDPRANFHKGEYIELSTALHAEAGIIAEAARQGLSLTGCDLYTTTFPCPPCAKLVAYSGIKRVFYAEGYSMLDGEEVMKSQGVEIIRVE